MNDLLNTEPSPDAIRQLARRALRETLAGETKDQARKLTRSLLLARLAMPGSDAYLDREEQLFDGLIQTGWIANRAKKMGGADSPEDVQQRVLIRLMVDFREGRLFAISKGYVETTVGYDVKTQWRKNTPASLSEEVEEGIQARDEFPDGELADVTARLARVWNRLADQQRRVLSLRYPELLPSTGEVSGGEPAAPQTLKTIGQMLQVSVSTTHRLACESRECLLSGLRDEGLDELADLLDIEMA